MNVISPETRMMGLPYGEEIMIVGRTVWTQSTSVTDRWTDGRTELRSQRPCNAERRTVKMADIVKQLLSLPATSTSSERVFSVCGAVFTVRRCRLTAGNLEKLVFLKYNNTQQ